jgi:twinkle protein
MSFSGYTEDSFNKGATIRVSGSQEFKKETVGDVSKLPCLAIPERGIDEKTAAHFGIRTKLSTSDGLTHEAHYFPYTLDGKVVGFKKRDLTQPKQAKYHFTTVGFQGVQCDLFGKEAANKTGGKKVFVTEGEYDAAILWQVIKAKYTGSNPTVLSISSGTANAVQNLGQKQNQKFLSKFTDVVMAFDADKATPAEKEKKIMKGKDAVAAVYGLMPNILVGDFPDDYDPCDMYREGLGEQLYWAVMKPIVYKPEGFITYDQIEKKAKEPPKLGKPWPWPSLTRLTLGRRGGEGYFIGSGVKQGKSEWVNQLTEYIINVDKKKIALFKFEEEPAITCQKIAGKMFHKDLTNAEKIYTQIDDGTWVDVWGQVIAEGERGYFTQDELNEAVDAVGDKVIYYNNYGRAYWDELKGAIRHAVLVEGVEDIIIDPLTRLTTGMSPGEANTELERFSDEISKMAKDLNFTYYVFCHLKAPDHGVPHEKGGKVQSNQFFGSRAMMRSCYYMIGIERNKDPETPIKEQNTSYFVVLEDRKHGRIGRVAAFYDQATGDYLEPPKGFLEDEYCETLAEWEEKRGRLGDDPQKRFVPQKPNKVKEPVEPIMDDAPPVGDSLPDHPSYGKGYDSKGTDRADVPWSPKAAGLASDPEDDDGSPF